MALLVTVKDLDRKRQQLPLAETTQQQHPRLLGQRLNSHGSNPSIGPGSLPSPQAADPAMFTTGPPRLGIMGTAYVFDHPDFQVHGAHGKVITPTLPKKKKVPSAAAAAKQLEIDECGFIFGGSPKPAKIPPPSTHKKAPKTAKRTVFGDAVGVKAAAKAKHTKPHHPPLLKAGTVADIKVSPRAWKGDRNFSGGGNRLKRRQTEMKLGRESSNEFEAETEAAQSVELLNNVGLEVEVPPPLEFGQRPTTLPLTNPLGKQAPPKAPRLHKTYFAKPEEEQTTEGETKTNDNPPFYRPGGSKSLPRKRSTGIYGRVPAPYGGIPHTEVLNTSASPVGAVPPPMRALMTQTSEQPNASSQPSDALNNMLIDMMIRGNSNTLGTGAAANTNNHEEKHSQEMLDQMMLIEDMMLTEQQQSRSGKLDLDAEDDQIIQRRRPMELEVRTIRRESRPKARDVSRSKKRDSKSATMKNAANPRELWRKLRSRSESLDRMKRRLLKRDVYENDPGDGPDAPVLPHPGEANDIPSIDGEAVHCELDEYAQLIQEMRNAGIVKAHRTGFLCFGKNFKDSFTGKDFVDWLVEKKRISRDKAIFMGRQLVTRKFGMNVEDDQDFRDDAHSLYKLGTSDSSRALNASEVAQCVQRQAGDIAEDLRKLILKLYGDFLSSDGRAVDYKGIGASKAFEAYKKMTLELQRVDLEKVSVEEKLAFFINTYNALVIHGTVEKGKPSNMWQRYKFFSTIAYSIGGHVFSLNDIENGILRANRGSMATLYAKPFGKGDVRYKLALPKAEPRIHFALNCGAKSCPPIKTFSAEQIDDQLNLATEAYLENDEAFTVTPPSDPLMPAVTTASSSSVPPTPSTTTSAPSSPSKQNTTTTEEDTNADDIEKDKSSVTEGSETTTTSNKSAKKEEEEEEEEAAPEVKSAPGVVHLSMLFKWYHNDFGKDTEEILKWIYERCPDQEKKRALGEVMQSSGYKIKYIPYDWGDNAQ